MGVAYVKAPDETMADGRGFIQTPWQPRIKILTSAKHTRKLIHLSVGPENLPEESDGEIKQRNLVLAEKS